MRLSHEHIQPCLMKRSKISVLFIVMLSKHYCYIHHISLSLFLQVYSHKRLFYNSWHSLYGNGCGGFDADAAFKALELYHRDMEPSHFLRQSFNQNNSDDTYDRCRSIKISLYATVQVHWSVGESVQPTQNSSLLL